MLLKIENKKSQNWAWGNFRVKAACSVPLCESTLGVCQDPRGRRGSTCRQDRHAPDRAAPGMASARREADFAGWDPLRPGRTPYPGGVACVFARLPRVPQNFSNSRGPLSVFRHEPESEIGVLCGRKNFKKLWRIQSR